MKGIFELAERILDLSFLIILALLIGLITGTMIHFESQMKTSGNVRIGIDLGENILSAPCLVDKKGVFLEEKLNEANGKISCLKFGTSNIILIETKERKWELRVGEFEEPKGKVATFIFPALVKNEDGTFRPAKVKVKIKKVSEEE